MSGLLRRFAFRYSKSNCRHWLPLMLADRVSEVEGVLEDLRRGHVPNIPGELGWRAEWKHNRQGLITRVLISTALLAAAFSSLRSKREVA